MSDTQTRTSAVPSPSRMPLIQRPLTVTQHRPTTKYSTGSKHSHQCNYCEKEAVESTPLTGLLLFLCEDCVWY